ncbi:hypothetical protein [Streptomyces sp. NPDC093094]|uniref:hypothetical protein n=1 Tax=Streptomyces sp. NPDC093094 TaxID=3366026 RepID=UPI003810537D
MAQLKPVSLDVYAEARDEAHLILSRLMARLTPGEHVVRLAVSMDGQKTLTVVLPVTVEGADTTDALVGVDQKHFDDFVFLLTVGLAQPMSWGLMYQRSPASEQDGPAYSIQAWVLEWAALTKCDAALAEELIGDGEAASFEDAFSVHSEDEDGETIYPPVAYTIL